MFGKQEDAFLALRSSAQEATAVGEYGKEWMHSTALNIVEDLFLRSLGNLKGCDFSAPHRQEQRAQDVQGHLRSILRSARKIRSGLPAGLTV